jgi:uncharacterized OB-fold protein
VYAFTVIRQQWHPGFPPPYVLASIELPEQAGLRVLSNVVGGEVCDVYVGMPVEVVFEAIDGVFVPLFRASAP